MRLTAEGTWLVTHAVATRAMIPRGRGSRIVCVTISAQTGLPSIVHCSAARATVDSLVRVLSPEWARFDIHLNSIALGTIATDVLLSKYPESVIADADRGAPLQRAGRPDEMAWIVALLASPAGNFTGATISLDGRRSNWYGPWPPPASVGVDRARVVEARR